MTPGNDLGQRADRYGRHAAVTDETPAPARDDDVVDDNDRLFSWREVLGYFTPPAPWATPPASLDELASYAHVGEWAAPRGLRRVVGIAYWYLIGLPSTVACRYAEWTVQRPGRLLTVLLVGAVLYKTPPGHWAAHTVDGVLQFVFHPLTWLF
ncbi:hypothetical protein ACFFX1_11210 [Dactylosporangium sucinum]|uniref:Uncharacterized protein n=1 Tax=Dactylosporangium sucinum TaxID=1424081 RepID=A0A917TGA3_9ACTN|nr:hypothetical protein [Dactylosporangium sucinum]GGM22334.1 hypothetical protein GCM10007977_024350 [Dactylosporangium sucinum]